MLSFKSQVDINSIKKFFYQKMVSSTLSILVFESLFSECDSKGFVLFLPHKHSSDDEQWINTSTWVARKSVSLTGLHETLININSSLIVGSI